MTKSDLLRGSYTLQPVKTWLEQVKSKLLEMQETHANLTEVFNLSRPIIDKHGQTSFKQQIMNLRAVHNKAKRNQNYYIHRDDVNGTNVKHHFDCISAMDEALENANIELASVMQKAKEYSTQQENGMVTFPNKKEKDLQEKLKCINCIIYHMNPNKKNPVQKLQSMNIQNMLDIDLPDIYKCMLDYAEEVCIELNLAQYMQYEIGGDMAQLLRAEMNAISDCTNKILMLLQPSISTKQQNWEENCQHAEDIAELRQKCNELIEMHNNNQIKITEVDLLHNAYGKVTGQWFLGRSSICKMIRKFTMKPIDAQGLKLQHTEFEAELKRINDQITKIPYQNKSAIQQANGESENLAVKYYKKLKITHYTREQNEDFAPWDQIGDHDGSPEQKYVEESKLNEEGNEVLHPLNSQNVKIITTENNQKNTNEAQSSNGFEDNDYDLKKPIDTFKEDELIKVLKEWKDFKYGDKA